MTLLWSFVSVVKCLCLSLWFVIDLCIWNSVADGASLATPGDLSHTHHLHKTSSSPAAADGNSTVYRPSSVSLPTFKSKRDIIATCSAADSQFVTSCPRTASMEAVDIAAEVTASVPRVHSASHIIAEVKNSSDGRAAEISHHRRRKKLKKNIFVAGDKQLKASSSRELPLWCRLPAAAAFTVGY